MSAIGLDFAVTTRASILKSQVIFYSMRNLYLSVSYIISTHAFADNTAAASTCYVVTDPNARSACLARAHKNSGMCYSVTDASLRAECLSRGRGGDWNMPEHNDKTRVGVSDGWERLPSRTQ